MVAVVLILLTPPDVPPLVAALGAPSFAARERAQKALADRGEVVLPALRAAMAADRDAEVRARAGRAEAAVLAAVRVGRVSKVELVPFPAGEFRIGNAGRDLRRWPGENPHAVRITRPFLFGAYEVTQGQYRAVAGSNPSYFCATGEGKADVAGLDTARFPVERVTWFDAVAFCNRLSALDGFPAYYEIQNIARDAEGIIAAEVLRLGGPGYRLPTEAEWETACRAGTEGRFNIPLTGTAADGNFRPGPATGYGSEPSWKSLGRTAKVGSYPPNARKAFDCHGNVAEWCWDLYNGLEYAGAKEEVPPADPAGPGWGSQRAARGGSWATTADSACRSAARYGAAPDARKDHIGFRVARTP